jgi:ABC-2 type transport system permease protein
MAVIRKYLRHVLCAIQETTAYRASYFINIVSQFVSYIAIFFLWRAVYAGGESVGGMTWEDMQGYLLVSLFASAVISGSSEFRVSRSIWTGNIAVELIRPVDYQKANFAITLGNGFAEGVLTAGIGLIFALFIGFTAPPADPLTWLFFAAALAFSFTTKFLVVYIFGLVTFWTVGGWGIHWFRRGLTDFFSGALIPLSFFPGWLQSLANALPFRAIVSTPALIFIERMTAGQILAAFALEAAWIVGLWFLARLVWHFAMRKLTIQGG